MKIVLTGSRRHSLLQITQMKPQPSGGIMVICGHGATWTFMIHCSAIPHPVREHTFLWRHPFSLSHDWWLWLHALVPHTFWSAKSKSDNCLLVTYAVSAFCLCMAAYTYIHQIHVCHDPWCTDRCACPPPILSYSSVSVRYIIMLFHNWKSK